MAENPQALIDSGALVELEMTLTNSIEGGGDLVGEVLNGLQASLAEAISNVFLFVFVILVVALIATTQLKVIPLRGRGGAPGGEPGGAPAPESAPARSSGDSSD